MGQRALLTLSILALILFTSFGLTPQKPLRLPRTAIENTTVCGTDSGFEQCKNLTHPYCAIDRKTGALHACVNDSQCPSNITSQTMVCDPALPFCCCKTTYKEWNDPDIDQYQHNTCTHLDDEHDDRFWLQACTLPELKHLDVCKINPTEVLYCATTGDNDNNTECRGAEKPFCGIDRQTGKLQGCVESSQCPNDTMGFPVVCHPDAASCCCQSTRGLIVDADFTEPLACNNILSWTNFTVWNQACSLPELKHVKACKKKPTPPTTTPPPTTPASPKTTSEGIMQPPTENTEGHDLMEVEEYDIVVWASIGTVVLLEGIMIGVLIYLCCFKKRVTQPSEQREEREFLPFQEQQQDEQPFMNPMNSPSVTGITSEASIINSLQQRGRPQARRGRGRGIGMGA